MPTKKSLLVDTTASIYLILGFLHNVHAPHREAENIIHDDGDCDRRRPMQDLKESIASRRMHVFPAVLLLCYIMIVLVYVF